MNNQIFSRLCSLMQELGFSAQAGDITTAEMRAYAAGLSTADELLQSAFCNAFIDTADEHGVSMLLSLLDLMPCFDIQEAKEEIIEAMSRGFSLPKKSEMTLDIFNMGFMLFNYGTKYRIKTYSGGFQRESFRNYGRVLKNCIPVYERLYNVDNGIDFDALDAFELNWFEIDDAAMPFYAWNAVAGHNYD